MEHAALVAGFYSVAHRVVDVPPLFGVSRRIGIANRGLDVPGDADDTGAAPALRVIPGLPPEGQDRPPAGRGTCRYRAPTARVPAGTRVRLPACPRCGERLGYRETADGAIFLHVHDPAFLLRVVDKTG
ncbi:MAG: hypothetical protein ACLQBX_05830 [Candidatus Limnocylindrales bacterium]